MIDLGFYDLAMETFGSFFGALMAVQNRTTQADAEAPQPNPLFQLRRGRAESPAWFMVQAMEFDPEPLSVANLRVRDIYASESIVAALLELMASEQWFDRLLKAEGEAATYTLTQKGRETNATLRDRFKDILPTLEPMPSDDLARLEAVLGRIIEASLNGGDPPGNWCLAHSRNRAPADDAPLLAKIAQYFSDFNAYRDDAHMAAWQRYNIKGYTWEAFAFIQAGTANSAQTIFEALAYRGYSRQDYALALQNLQERAWIETIEGQATQYQLTQKGQDIWAKTETLTNNYFYGPWKTLADDDVDAAQTLLAQLNEGLKKISEENGNR